MTRQEFMQKYLGSGKYRRCEEHMLEFDYDLDEVILAEKTATKDLGIIQTVKHDYKIMYEQALEAGQQQTAYLIMPYIATISQYKMDRIATKEDPPRLQDFVKWSKEYNQSILAQVMCDLENWDLKEFKKKKSLRLTLNNWMSRSKGRVNRGFNPPMAQV